MFELSQRQEFTVRDSTWYPVGARNTSFVLAKRDEPNGVQMLDACNVVSAAAAAVDSRLIGSLERTTAQSTAKTTTGANLHLLAVYGVAEEDDGNDSFGCSSSLSSPSSGVQKEWRWKHEKRTFTTRGPEGIEPKQAARSLKQQQARKTSRGLESDVFVTPRKTRSTTVTKRGGRPTVALAPTRTRGGNGAVTTGKGFARGRSVYHAAVPGNSSDSRDASMCWGSLGGGGHNGDTNTGAGACAGPLGNDYDDGGVLVHRICLSLSDQQRAGAKAAPAGGWRPAAAEGGMGVADLISPAPSAVSGVMLGAAAGELVSKFASSSAKNMGPKPMPALSPDRASSGEGLGPAAPEVVAKVVEIRCREDPSTDMFQLGRMHGCDNDFSVRGPLHQSSPGGKVCGPVSRYAVRFLVDRSPPHRARIFAGGFDRR